MGFCSVLFCVCVCVRSCSRGSEASDAYQDISTVTCSFKRHTRIRIPPQGSSQHRLSSEQNLISSFRVKVLTVRQEQQQNILGGTSSSYNNNPFFFPLSLLQPVGVRHVSHQHKTAFLIISIILCSHCFRVMTRICTVLPDKVS